MVKTSVARRVNAQEEAGLLGRDNGGANWHLTREASGENMCRVRRVVYDGG